jgi:hypothetical protein
VEGAGNADHGASTINLAQAANLTATTQIEVHLLDEQSADYKLATTIDDPLILSALVSEMDQVLLLQPALFCMAQAELFFQLTTGEELTFSYGCVAEDSGGEGSYLQGGDTPLQDQAIEPPVAFQDLLSPYIER